MPTSSEESPGCSPSKPSAKPALEVISKVTLVPGNNDLTLDLGRVFWVTLVRGELGIRIVGRLWIVVLSSLCFSIFGGGEVSWARWSSLQAHTWGRGSRLEPRRVFDNRPLASQLLNHKWNSGLGFVDKEGYSKYGSSSWRGEWNYVFDLGCLLIRNL